MKVIVTDFSFPDLATEGEILAPLGVELVGAQCKTAEALISVVHDADAVITQFAPVSAAVISAMRQAQVIVRYGVGVDNVDLEAAREKRIPVCNVPDYCIDEVADHTLAFILSVTRQVVQNCNYVRNGKWGLATPLAELRALRDQTVGLIGFGRIGREVAARLRAFKARVLVFDPMVTVEQIAQADCVPAGLEELLTKSDIVSLHCPSTARTRGMFNAASIAMMKRGVVLVNLARGDLVDSAALTMALENGHIGAAALDVFAPEPIPAVHPILELENVIVAPHIASASVQAVRKLRETVAHIVAQALRGESLPNVVNGVKTPPQAALN